MKQRKKDRLESKRAGRQVRLAGPAETGDKKDIGVARQDERNHKYYIMTREEAEALVSGDMKTVEDWVNNLDRDRATWLLRLLINKRG